ncbi:hypothetical protein DID88_007360 [Monilinia fructigena]|uniref:Uncharacterized protein n=1 Tax=Monilinia fructigena TaxID=38457 RepID=A0A395J872_9HELO|nr:hypothetical protein DID88_007360 [Monilinia fructigena]
MISTQQHHQGAHDYAYHYVHHYFREADLAQLIDHDPSLHLHQVTHPTRIIITIAGGPPRRRTRTTTSTIRTPESPDYSVAGEAPAQKPDNDPRPERGDIGRDLSNLAHLYTDNEKYSSEGDNFEYKFQIFISHCSRLDIQPQSIMRAFPTMLTGVALDFYHTNLEQTSMYYGGYEINV